jgi:hypothetical protein
MTKNTKMLLGVGAVAVVGYLIWKNQSTTSFAGPVGRRLKTFAVGKDKLCPRGMVWNGLQCVPYDLPRPDRTGPLL